MFEDELTGDSIPALRIVIAKHDLNVRAIFICRDWKGLRVHWYGKHTIACCGTDACPACDVGMEPVKKYYVVAKEVKNGNQAIVMLTPMAAAQVAHHRHRVDGLLGMEVIIGRAAARNTAPMTAKVINYHPDTSDFGTERLERVMLRIFAANANLKVA